MSDFSRLYKLGKLFAFTVIKGFFPIFRLALFKCKRKSEQNQNYFCRLPFAVNVMLNLSIILISFESANLLNFYTRSRERSLEQANKYRHVPVCNMHGSIFRNSKLLILMNKQVNFLIFLFRFIIKLLVSRYLDSL